MNNQIGDEGAKNLGEGLSNLKMLNNVSINLNKNRILDLGA